MVIFVELVYNVHAKPLRESTIMSHTPLYTRVPTSWVGPLYFKAMHELDHSTLDVSLSAPLATYETTLFHSVGRGAKLTRLTQTLETTLISDHMTRSVLFECEHALEAAKLSEYVKANLEVFQNEVVSKHSKYAKLKKIDTHIISNLLFIRFAYDTSNASGHNMSTFASDAIASELMLQFPTLKYISVSGNYCTDKKTSSVNAILGRGKHMVASMRISRELCETQLKTTPERIIDLNIKKNMIGSIIAGGVQSANAHFANMLLAFYIATGQNGANIVEGSQGITHAYLDQDDLIFTVTLPNVIVGTVGHGKDVSDASLALQTMGCDQEDGAKKMAHIAAALVLCGELSLMSALSNQHELTQAHLRLERKGK
jgi:hydroxymethylglutaryl-CoA reductase (NADPH)